MTNVQQINFPKFTFWIDNTKCKNVSHQGAPLTKSSRNTAEFFFMGNTTEFYLQTKRRKDYFQNVAFHQAVIFINFKKKNRKHHWVDETHSFKVHSIHKIVVSTLLQHCSRSSKELPTPLGRRNTQVPKEPVQAKSPRPSLDYIAQNSRH